MRLIKIFERILPPFSDELEAKVLFGNQLGVRATNLSKKFLANNLTKFLVIAQGLFQTLDKSDWPDKDPINI